MFNEFIYFYYEIIPKPVIKMAASFKSNNTTSSTQKLTLKSQVAIWESPNIVTKPLSVLRKTKWHTHMEDY